MQLVRLAQKGDRSYLVRDKQIEVLKNVYGGVQVRHMLRCKQFSMCSSQIEAY